MEEQQQITAGLNASQFRDLTYPRLRLTDFTMDENLPNLLNCRVYTTTKVHLNSLNILPLELLQHILSQLDLHTLTNFQRVNQRALQLVESIPQYKAINTHARSTLRGILSTESGRWVTCKTLYTTICTAECEHCGDFGGYIYIITCKRVCFLCFTRGQAYLPLRHIHAVEKFGLNRQILNTLPQMRSIPGTYSPNHQKFHDRLILVDYNCARRAGIKLHGSVAAMEKHVSDITNQKERRYDVRLSQRSTDPSALTTRGPQTEDPFDRESGNPLRFMAIVPTPWLNRISQDVELGSYCIGCERSYDSYRNRPMYFRRKFNVGLFSEHLRQCGGIKNRKHHPD